VGKEAPLNDVGSRWINSQRKSYIASARFWLTRPASFFVRLVEFFFVGTSLSNVVIKEISSIIRIDQFRADIQSFEVLVPPRVMKREMLDVPDLIEDLYDTCRAINRYSIANVDFHLKSGVSSLFGGFIVEEFYGSEMGIFGSGTILHEYRKIKKGSKEKLRGTWIVVETPKYYFHFIAQTLPTVIRSLQHESKPNIICHEDSPTWLKQLLLELNPATYFSKSSVINVEIAILTSVPELAMDDEVRLLRSKWPSQESQPQSIVYISREGQNRDLGGMGKEVTKYLHSKKVQMVDPSKLDWGEEISLFANTSKLILVNGSAVANLVWMKEGTSALILFDFRDFSTQIEKSFIKSTGIKTLSLNVDETKNSEIDILNHVATFLDA
jgi:hypothetical protein